MIKDDTSDKSHINAGDHSAYRAYLQLSFEDRHVDRRLDV